MNGKPSHSKRWIDAWSAVALALFGYRGFTGGAIDVTVTTLFFGVLAFYTGHQVSEHWAQRPKSGPAQPATEVS